MYARLSGSKRASRRRAHAQASDVAGANASGRRAALQRATALSSARAAPFADPHQHVERSGRGAAGRGDIFAQSRGIIADRCSNSPEPATVSRASFSARSARQAGRGAGLRQLRQAGRHKPAPTRHRRHRIHQCLVVHPFDRAGRGEQTMREVALRALACAAPRPLCRGRSRPACSASRAPARRHAATLRQGIATFVRP